MGRGPAPGWKARKEPITDHYLLASVNQAGGPGQHHPTTGAYSELVIKGLASREEATEWKRSLHRCAVYLHRNGIASIGVSTKIERAGNGYLIRFTVYNKTHSQNYVLETYGRDRSEWPYDVRRRGGAS